MKRYECSLSNSKGATYTEFIEAKNVIVATKKFKRFYKNKFFKNHSCKLAKEQFTFYSKRR